MKFLRPLLSPLLVLTVFGLDRLTKSWVIHKFYLGEIRPVLPFFNLTYVENTGAAFSIGHNNNRFFIGTAIVILLVILYLRKKWESADPQNRRLKIAFALVIGGAVGNLYDRIRFGSVIDFLDFFAGGWHWPAFNLADSAICAGAFLLFLSQWKSTKLEP